MRYLTTGGSHRPRLTAIIEGVPSWTSSYRSIHQFKELKRRQGGYGRRSSHKKIESDKVEITSGVRHGRTMGGRITPVNVTNLIIKMVGHYGMGRCERQKKSCVRLPSHARVMQIWSAV